VGRHLRAAGAGVTDLLPVLAGHAAEEVYLPDDTIHLSERGHQIVVEVLAEAIGTLLTVGVD